MEGQYSKGDVLSFNLFKSYPQLKGQFAKYCKVFEIRLRSLVSTYSILPLNEEQSTKLDFAGFITEWRASGKNTPKSLTVEDFKALLLLEIQLLLGCDVEWSVPLPQASADIDHHVLSTAGNDADADESAEEGGSSGIAAGYTAAGCGYVLARPHRRRRRPG